MTAPRLIGLCGFAGAGKDTVGALLVERYGFARVAFADALKDLLLTVDPEVSYTVLMPDGYPSAVVGKHLSELVEDVGWDTAKGYDAVRRLLQRLGQGARNVLGEDVWVDTAMNTAGIVLLDGIQHGRRHSGVVFTDVRYVNEATRVSDEGGALVYIHRPGVTRVNDHPSEDLAEQMADAYAEHDQWHYMPDEFPYHHALNNDGGPYELNSKVVDLAGRLGLTSAVAS